MMNLALYLDAGIHQGGWRHPEAVSSGGSNWPLFRRIAQQAEAAKLDMIFVADKLAIDDIYGGDLSATVRSRPQGWSEPLTLLAALAAVTDRIGLGGTVSSSYSLPYTTARQLANIDHLSGGRAAWNLVTSVSDAEARNFGRDRHYSHAERYARAAEFIQLMKNLWDSFDDDAIVMDKAGAEFARPDGFRYLNHQGAFFDVRGPLNIPRPPQGYPVVIQAGVSDAFIDLAAQHAEVLFVVQPEQQRAQRFYQTLKSKAQQFGRTPDRLRILPGIVPVLAETHAAAQEKDRFLKSLITAESALSFMSASMNHDLAQYPLDGPAPDLREVITGSKGRFQYVIAQALEEKLTLGEMAIRYAESLSFPSPVGTPDEVAAMMIDWYRSGACDGFVVLPTYLEASGNLFLDEVVPRLQRAGVFRTAYPQGTLRDTLGLARPENGLR
ncbi:NtaA/DmoA family FMN-dependent monooxygenase [Pantoea latae]|uniref:Nitrilotriacetate monooxygenase n=1 Tax=Pantoea latae TaxID=1964541 RepID=A0A1V9D9Z9_9GAMM|nr:NtaA/DmoA family FMN-dependent monooxygenase [Pantoea latae]OQP30687.1 nitrilotriacetate monooxygenase [Pantoea latae]